MNRIDIDEHYIDGAWVAAESSDRVTVDNAATGEVIGSVPAGTAAEVDRAVAAAVAALPAWSRTDPKERTAILETVGRAMLADKANLAEVQANEVGTPITVSEGMHVDLPAMTMSSQQDYVEAAFTREQVGNAEIVRVAAGVVGLITPWNFPLTQVTAKLAPALAAGCTVVLKVSEVAPLTTKALVDMFAEAGLPAGVLNVVFGDGPTVGEAIVTHPDVDLVSFTGSTAVGKRISALAAETLKKVTLELGGKSPLVMLPDADATEVAQRLVLMGFTNNGQACTALTRLVAPRSRKAEVEEALKAAIDAVVVGDPLDRSTTLGPLISARQRDRAQGYITSAQDEGARLLVGGPGAPEGLEAGYYVRPTVFADVSTDMRIAREEVFGPVLVVQDYDDSLPGTAADDDAVRVANATVYGLMGAVMGKDEKRVAEIADRIQSAHVEINGAAFNPLAPNGGTKQSGHGREFGRFGIEEFLVYRTVRRPD